LFAFKDKRKKEEGMDRHKIKIEWCGPFSPEEVIKKMDDAGKLPDYGGEDYDLYQIYGKHILCGEDTLLYIGKAVEKTFAIRFRRHKKCWIVRKTLKFISVGSMTLKDILRKITGSHGERT